MNQYLLIMFDDAHDQTFNVILTSRMLPSSPLKEISSRDYEVAKSLGLNNGKGNVSSTLTCKEFIKQQGLVRRLH